MFKKKLLSVVLTVMLIITVIPLGVLTAGAETYGNFTYERVWESGYGYIDEAIITACSESARGAITIPSYINGYTVTEIGGSAFYNCRGITSILIPNTVEYIGHSAFEECNNLTTVNIPSSVTGIGAEAFYNCYKLSKISIPGSVANIGDDAFSGCNNLTIANIGNGVLGIGAGAFSGCSKLKSITIPKSISNIEGYAFSDCVSLTSVSLPYGIVAIGDRAFCNCGSLTKINIPKSVIEIGSYAFAGTGLTSVTIPGTVTNLGSYAFVNCTNLKSVHIENGVVEIGNAAFYDCSNLKSVAMPKSVKKIGSSAFYLGYEGEAKVYYAGSKAQKSGITIENYNSGIDGTWYYNVCSAHSYSTACDTKCNKCGWTRTVSTKHTVKTTTTKATITKNGKIAKKCSKCGTVTSSSVIKYPKTIKLSTTAYTYNGKVKTPAVTVKDSAGKTLKKNTDYTVTYATGRKNVGAYKVIVKFKGKYSGTKTLAFKINPVKTSVYKVVGKRKSIVVAINKKSTQVTGYQVQYSTSYSFYGAKTKTLTSYKSTKTTISGLYSYNYYYVRVRTYKKVGGKTYYSPWSASKYAMTE